MRQLSHRSLIARFTRPLAFIAALALAVLPLAARGQTKPAGVPGHMFFYKATRGSSTVYLLGSVHLMRRDMYPLPDEIQAAFDKSDYLACEIDLNQAIQGNAAQEIAAKALYTDGTTVFDHLPADVAKDLHKALADRNLPEFMFKTMKPWTVAAMLGVSDAMAGGYTAVGVDQRFMNQAAQKKMPIRELESVDFQLNLLSNLPEKTQVAWLKSQLVPPDKAKETMEAMGRAWAIGDEPELTRTATTGMDDVPDLQKLLVDDRNAGMAQKVEGYLKEDQTGFVIVGAAHLTGPHGVVARLRKAGIAVVQPTVTLQSVAALEALAAATQPAAATAPAPLATSP